MENAQTIGQEKSKKAIGTEIDKMGSLFSTLEAIVKYHAEHIEAILEMPAAVSYNKVDSSATGVKNSGSALAAKLKEYNNRLENLIATIQSLIDQTDL